MSRVPFANSAAADPPSTGSISNPSGVNYRTLRDYGATANNTSTTSSTTGLLHHHHNVAASSFGVAAFQPNALPDVNFAGFSPTEFMSLSESIAQNVSAVRSSLHMLDQAIRKIGTHSDSQRFRTKLKNEQDSMNRKITTTTTDLKRLTDVVRHGDKQQKLNVNRLRSEFMSIVAGYDKCQKELTAKQRINVLPPVDDQQQPTDGDDGTADATAGGEGGYQQQASVEKHQQQLRQSLEFERGLLLEREERMSNIQSSVLDINAIMQQLGSMTEQQGTNIDMIEGDINNATGAITDGLSELEKAALQQAKYRKKVLFLLLLAVIIGLILTAIIVSALRS